MSVRRLDAVGTNADQAANEAVAGAGGSLVIKVHRQGRDVNLTVSAANEYVAIELYEHVVRSLKQGKLTLDINKTP